MLVSKSGREVLLATLNHLDTIRGFVALSPPHVAMVDKACLTFKDVSDLEIRGKRIFFFWPSSLKASPVHN